jgi:hypothetical protein
MPQLELCLLFLTVAGLMLGSWSICWARRDSQSSRVLWGRRLFVATILVLGGTALVAAFARADGLAPLGLLAGFLVVAMVWESPRPALPVESRLDN